MRRFSFLFGILAAGALLSAACEQKTATQAAGTAEKALPPLTALPGSAFNVEWTRPAIPSSVPAGQGFIAQVAVKNTGDTIWPDSKMSDPNGSTGGAGAVRLSYRWLSAAQEGRINTYVGYDARIELPRPVAPGESVTVPVAVKAPSQPGDYRLQFDLVQELVAWFGGRGAARLIIPVTVQ